MVADAEHDTSFQKGDLKDLGASVGAASNKAAFRFSNVLSKFAPGSLTARIIIINFIGLIILASGIFYLNQFRQGLIDARVEAMMSQAQIIAGALASSATVDTSNSVVLNHERLLEMHKQNAFPSAEEQFGNFDFPINPEQAGPVLRKLVARTKIVARLFDQEGVLLSDSNFLYASGAVLKFELPPLEVEKDSILKTWWKVARDWFTANDYPLQKEFESENGKEFPEVNAALNGASVSVVRANKKGEVIVSVSVPVQRFRAVQGALVLSTRDGEIDETLVNERWHIIRMFVVAALVAVLLSLVLASTIAEPMRRLARSADQIRKGINKRVEIPDFSTRRDEIGDLSGALRDMTNALYNRIDAIEGFAADVAHELKNPLTSVRSAVETLDYVKDDAQRARLIEIVKDDVKRLDRLISDISDASRLDAELARNEAEPVDMRDLLETFAQLANENVRGESTKVHLKVEPVAAPARQKSQQGSAENEGFFVMGHDSRLGQVVRNLLDNARSFSPPDSDVWINLRQLPGQVEFRIEDSGPGISEENLDRIFNRFYTDRPEAAFGENSGLGLSISKQIVDAHRGRIWAENWYATDSSSEEPKIGGARFTVRLPVRPREPRERRRGGQTSDKA
ncbi:MAG: HAMP domain-containing protein [Alphaproteobacteria bacterium]|nr:HAMP domain-containing protein [Alphaproteobacteria bacterium]